MNVEQLHALGIEAKYFDPLLETFTRFEINTPLRQAAFIGQCQHETANFKDLQENLNYSAQGLVKTWPTHFDAENAADYAHQPEKIANRAYANRMGNGDETSGDGWRHRGAGWLQLTGKEDQLLFGDYAQRPVDADYLLTPEGAVLSAGWVWRRKNLNPLADDKNYELMSKKINGGTLGMDDRIAKIEKALSILA